MRPRRGPRPRRVRTRSGAGTRPSAGPGRRPMCASTSATRRRTSPGSASLPHTRQPVAATRAVIRGASLRLDSAVVLGGQLDVAAERGQPHPTHGRHRGERVPSARKGQRRPEHRPDPGGDLLGDVESCVGQRRLDQEVAGEARQRLPGIGQRLVEPSPQLLASGPTGRRRPPRPALPRGSSVRPRRARAPEAPWRRTPPPPATAVRTAGPGPGAPRCTSGRGRATAARGRSPAHHRRRRRADSASRCSRRCRRRCASTLATLAANRPHARMSHTTATS